MPKIIKNPEIRLIEEAKRQVQQLGYGAMTIRSVAKACGMGVGTVYNYFPSKDALLAACLLEDWNLCLAAIGDAGKSAQSPEPVLRCMYDQLTAFLAQNRSVFADETAAASFAGSVGRYHALLRDQLAAPVRKFCASDFAAKFVAEALLTWTTDGQSFDEIYGMLRKLF